MRAGAGRAPPLRESGLDFKDYYAALGVAKDATADDIKKSFRKLARKYHPDVSKEPDADARMKEINEAYTVLSDPEKRAAYDQLGGAYQPGQDFRPPPDWDAGFEFSGRGSPGAGAGDYGDYSDFFAELFGRMGAGGARARGEPFDAGNLHARGEDHHAKILVDIEDVYRGASRQISLRAPRIDAEGRLLLDTRTLNVQIPKGLREGQLMRLAGQGGPGLGEGKPGDLLLEVHFKPHPRFHAHGADVTMTLPVAPWEAAMGAVVALHLPDGASLNVRIPAGAQSGRQLRVRGKGIPSSPPGDLLLDVRVVVPPAETPRAKELYEAMARDLEFDPRAGMES